MKTYIALFRGINVGGSHILPMKRLQALLENLGLQNIRTYIQSGNVVFQSEEMDVVRLSEQLGTTIEMHLGFKPFVLLLELKGLEAVVQSNPFPQGVSEPTTLHAFFLSSEPAHPKLNAMENLKLENERFDLRGGAFYLYAPDGIGRSKLAANVERLLGVPVTGRNWRTVEKILAMAKQSDVGG